MPQFSSINMATLAQANEQNSFILMISYEQSTLKVKYTDNIVELTHGILTD